ncbi:hypothetical protein [Terrimonas alba]|uniref:hypothetical protein n=1 Tax=Terrimonas alba TaxID=3349636 RepID=UPI00406CAD14
MALAFRVFKMDRLDSVKPTFSESSFSDIFRFAIITSKFTIIGIGAHVGVADLNAPDPIAILYYRILPRYYKTYPVFVSSVKNGAFSTFLMARGIASAHAIAGL